MTSDNKADSTVTEGVEEITDTVVEGIEDSELAEVIVVIFACLYLGASQLEYIASTPELDIAALAVIGAAVGMDSLYKKIKRRK